MQRQESTRTDECFAEWWPRSNKGCSEHRFDEDSKYRAGGYVEPGYRVLFPYYPPLAIDTHITGTVNIGLLVTPQGDIGDNFRVLDGPPLLVQSAINAIRQCKFRPNEVRKGK